VRLLPFCLLSAVLACAQGPPVGVIDYFGVRRVPRQALETALGLKVGQPLPRSKGDVEERLEKVAGVVSARLEAVCCEEGKAILYVGIQERGAPRFDYLETPQGAVRLPEEGHFAYAQFLACVNEAAREGDVEEDLTQGHSLFHRRACRQWQEKFQDLARQHESKLREVLRDSGDDEHRAMAAYLIGYAPEKRTVIDDLLRAIRDPDDTVRNNAVRSLAAIAILAARRPDLGLRISPTWFIEMLGSLLWQDRRAALMTLLTLTETRDERLLAHLRERAMADLKEMALWHHLPHALPAFILLGRAAGIPEESIQEAWSRGDRLAFVQKATAPKKK